MNPPGLSSKTSRAKTVIVRETPTPGRAHQDKEEGKIQRVNMGRQRTSLKPQFYSLSRAPCIPRKKKNSLGLPGLAAKEGITTRRKSPALSRHPPSEGSCRPGGAGRGALGCMRGRNSGRGRANPTETLTPPRLRRSPLTCWNARPRGAPRCSSKR